VISPPKLWQTWQANGGGGQIGRVFSDSTLQMAAKRYGKSVSNIVLRWLVQQKGVVALSRTEREERIQENLDIFDFSLEETAMNASLG
jgi:2,5-diketo-D-gluconate reductase B